MLRDRKLKRFLKVRQEGSLHAEKPRPQSMAQKLMRIITNMQIIGNLTR